jgi:hypothetical protein
MIGNATHLKQQHKLKVAMAFFWLMKESSDSAGGY